MRGVGKGEAACLVPKHGSQWTVIWVPSQVEGYWVAYVGNISFEVTPEELKEVFADVGVDKVISAALPLFQTKGTTWHDIWSHCPPYHQNVLSSPQSSFSTASSIVAKCVLVCILRRLLHMFEWSQDL